MNLKISADNWQRKIAVLIEGILVPRGYKTNNLRKQVSNIDFLTKHRVAAAYNSAISVFDDYRLQLVSEVRSKIHEMRTEWKNTSDLLNAEYKRNFFVRSRKKIRLYKTSISNLNAGILAYQHVEQLIWKDTPGNEVKHPGVTSRVSEQLSKLRKS